MRVQAFWGATVSEDHPPARVQVMPVELAEPSEVRAASVTLDEVIELVYEAGDLSEEDDTKAVGPRPIRLRRLDTMSATTGAGGMRDGF